MQPNDQQGYVQPNQEPVQPAVPAPAPVSPAAPQVSQPPIDVAPQPDDVAQPADDNVEDEPLTWSALEFIHHEKGTLWFIVFGVIALGAFGAALYFQQWLFAALVAVIVVVIIVSSRRPPRELTYALDDEGLRIDGAMYPFENFKAFGVVHDGDEYSIMLIPTQRFQPAVTVYFPEEAGEDIVDMFGMRLPIKDLHLDVVDRIVRFLRLQ